ncbi:MAG: hypothetical protein KUF77_13635 [Candidatus Thiodiazotropha sp. (ex Lucina aurantia)]|nr:hypothetical protein [Candidatus Thiodiazotropha sp. (ex Lucina pensylvanica)]MBT3024395.1 hypothetical protein [Candidatus Thiodiazotropha taylori]MBT3055896.1 hypothetical protein [Candidatus Thiodiazotropha sp. (ex Codakia orbicularis)]MBV2104061.1 hypothetical protein [Candidatus Thiodiazotropha sp. (ex Lucina aurantia)]MBV2099303.1 hypothetical protein [Candidatus Thiodiazotropha sp. (ex Codakia orbicularis)]
MKHIGTSLLLAASLASGAAIADSASDQAEIEALRERIDRLEKDLDAKLEAMADSVESQQEQASMGHQVHLGGYGEMHYNHLDVDGVDERELDFHRFVIFFGYDFSETIRFVSELEVEHIIASSSKRGAVELEQAFVEIDIYDDMQAQFGAILMPVGIINETHEPPTFYGVERPVVETTIIPTTWWSNGVNLIYRTDNALRFDLMISEGLKTSESDPFNLKAGKQKGSFADAFDLAVTGRVAYTGVAGLEVAGYAQYQPDLDQSAEDSYAEEATLVGGHIIYQMGDFTAKGLYARWDLGGDDAEQAGKDVQDGGYLELSWRPRDEWGFFVRQSAWSQEADVDAAQTDFGLSYFPDRDVVFKFDYQLQNDDAGNSDGFNLGVGYQF